MAQSNIEWTEMSWNPVTGCTKISAGCVNCYAEIFSKRLKAMGQNKYKNGFKLTIQPNSLIEPYKWKKSKIVFVNSMSDLFHEKVPIDYIQKVFKVMRENPQHVFQILTKRSERLLSIDKLGLLEWTHNMWMGVSVEDNESKIRIENLNKTQSHVKFLSCEPLISPLNKLNLKKIDWVIVGGESGKKSRPMKEDWVKDIKNQCKKSHVAFFFKQWGGQNKKKTGRLLEGRTWDDMPDLPELFGKAV